MASTKEEIRTILGQIRDLAGAYADLGIDPPALSSDTLRYLEGQGPEAVRDAHPAASPATPHRFTSLKALEDHIGECRRCGLSKTRKNLVFGEGSPTARLMFIGEGPGADEDAVGRPFVGKAGQLLTRIIVNGMGLTREAVYICNIVKCRAPRNRDPEPGEIEACLPFLKHQIAIIRPEVICTLGRVAARALFGKGFKITRHRGQWQAYQGIPAIPTYHPAYLLRYPDFKRQTWEDIKQVMKKLGLEVTP